MNCENGSVFAMVTNDTDELLRGVRVVFALFDEDDNLLYADSVEPYYVGLPPGEALALESTDVSDGTITR